MRSIQPNITKREATIDIMFLFSFQGLSERKKEDQKNNKLPKKASRLQAKRDTI